MRDGREAKLTRLLRLIGPIVNNWIIKVCKEITKDSAKLKKKCEVNACKSQAESIHTWHYMDTFMQASVSAQ